MMVANGTITGDDDWVDDASDEVAELELHDDESLPWLESDEYDDDAGTVDTVRIIGFAALLLLLLGLIIGGLWWLTNRDDGANAVADGSTIEAPAGDYKERPDDAGGKEFAGTGNVAPAVGQGETREGTIADGSSGAGNGAAASKIEDSPAANAGASFTNKNEKAEGGAAAKKPAAPAQASAGGVGVQVGAFGSEARAKTGWNELRGQSTALNGVKYRIVKGTADIGTVYRLQAVTANAAAADQLCAKLKADGLPCQVKK
ncbi:MAG: SPOR domain-containing protein [Erythrobacter sp.]